MVSTAPGNNRPILGNSWVTIVPSKSIAMFAIYSIFHEYSRCSLLISNEAICITYF